jgi:hypothetical protein
MYPSRNCFRYVGGELRRRRLSNDPAIAVTDDGSTRLTGRDRWHFAVRCLHPGTRLPDYDGFATTDAVAIAAAADTNAAPGDSNSAAHLDAFASAADPVAFTGATDPDAHLDADGSADWQPESVGATDANAAADPDAHLDADVAAYGHASADGEPAADRASNADLAADGVTRPDRTSDSDSEWLVLSKGTRPPG